MNDIRIEIDRAEVAKQLLKSPEMAAIVAAKCAAIAAKAGANGGTFSHDVRVGPNRLHGMVWTEDFPAMELEATQRVLTRAIDAGRS